MSVLDGRPGEGTWSVFAMKVVEERDAAREALANSDACWRMEQEFLQRKLAGGDAHIKSLEGLLVDAARERDEAKNRARRACQILIEEIGADGPTDVDAVAEHATVLIRELRGQVSDLQAAIADCWQARVALALQAAAERDKARDELAKTFADFHDVLESRDKVIEERERARQACNAYWHDLTRIALLCTQTDDEYPLKAVERLRLERDEALAQVARREREHEALLETAQKALAHVEAERDALQEELDDTRDASAYKFRGTYLEDASGGRWWGQSHIQAALIDSALIQAKLLEERDEARATLAFLQAEYVKAEDETLTRDALELKIRLLEQQLSAIRKAVYDLRVLRSSCEDSYDGEFRVHLIEDQYNALIKLASE